MGSGSSKAAAKSGDDRRTRSKAARVFNSSCFGFSSSILSDDQKEEESGRSKGKKCTDEGERISNGEDDDDEEAYRRESGKTPSMTTTPKLELSQEDQEMPFQFDSGSGSSSLTRATIGLSSNPSTRLPCRFGFNNEGIAFRLSRTLSLGSSRDRALLSTTQSTDGGRVDHSVGDSSGDGAEETVSSRNEVNIDGDVSGHSRGNHVEGENSETRHSARWMVPQEPLEGSVRFSRTRSVGRLRDRVLRGNSVPEGLFHPGMLEEVSVGHLRQPNGRQVLAGSRRAPSFSDTGNEVLPASSNNRVNLRSNSMDRRHDRAYEAAQRREASSHDLLEHRSTFLERRRRIRSQVRALERLGRRFANLSGHDRSCILSGQHRTGRCICRTNNRSANPDDDMSARASISRIVMLAEALFEVLDEIHQQSAVLSSRPSFSSVGSVPAPKEIVESMPTKVHTKPQRHKNEENEQCYICLVEYEEGDCMRVLPCNHEFHQTCIDKWLKEIHRVCPLCRGDVCRANTSNME